MNRSLEEKGGQAFAGLQVRDSHRLAERANDAEAGDDDALPRFLGPEIHVSVARREGRGREGALSSGSTPQPRRKRRRPPWTVSALADCRRERGYQCVAIERCPSPLPTARLPAGGEGNPGSSDYRKGDCDTEGLPGC